MSGYVGKNAAEAAPPPTQAKAYATLGFSPSERLFCAVFEYCALADIILKQDCYGCFLLIVGDCFEVAEYFEVAKYIV